MTSQMEIYSDFMSLKKLKATFKGLQGYTVLGVWCLFKLHFKMREKYSFQINRGRKYYCQEVKVRFPQNKNQQIHPSSLNDTSIQI